jgi:putative membrane protein
MNPINQIAIAIPAGDTDWGHMGDWGAGNWLAMVAFWALVIVVVIWASRGFAASRGDGPSSAAQTLERRLAAGEIDVEEYRERSAALEDGPRRIS